MTDETRNEHIAKMEKVVATCDEALKRDPKAWAAYHDKGVALLELGRFPEAAQTLDRGLEYNKRDLEALYLAGVAYGEAKDYDRAISRWRDVVKANPQHAMAHLMLGKTYTIKGMWDPAVFEFRKAIEFQPDAKPPLAYAHLAEVYLTRGRLAEAASCLEKAKAISPEDPQIHLNLGALYLDLGHPEQALAEAREAVKLGARSATAHLNAGMALMRLGRAEEAATEYRAGLAVDSKDPELHINLGEAHLATGDIDEAITSWKSALAVAPRYANAHHNLGVAYFRQGLFDAAIAEWRKTLELEARHRSARVNLAAAYAGAGEFDKAITEWKPLLETHRGNPDILAGLAELYLRKGDLGLAADYSRQAVIATPGHPRAEFVLGVVLARRGQVREALGAMRKAAAQGEQFLSTQASTIRNCLDEVTVKALEREAAATPATQDAALIAKVRELHAKAP